MTLQRVQILLSPEQRQKLKELAQARGASVSELTRQSIDIGLEHLSQEHRQAQMCAALDAAQQLREKIRQRTGKPLDVDVVEDIRQMREARDDELLRRN